MFEPGLDFETGNCGWSISSFDLQVGSYVNLLKLQWYSGFVRYFV